MFTYLFSNIEDTCKIETVKKSDGTEIPFKEIVLHFLNVENIINAAAQTKSLSTSGTGNPHGGNQIPPVTLLESTICEKVAQVLRIEYYV